MNTHTPKHNQLLAALASQEYHRLEPDLELVRLERGDILHDTDKIIEFMYFPTSAVISIQPGGAAISSLSLAMIGCEGVVGAAAASNRWRSPFRAIVLTPGLAYRLKQELAAWELAQHGLLQHRVLRFETVLLNRFALTAQCASHHTIEQRLGRLLLELWQRTGDTVLNLTHAGIAAHLGVRREAVTEAASKLQAAKRIAYSRGRVLLLDAEGLKTHACSCHKTGLSSPHLDVEDATSASARLRNRLDSAQLRMLAEERARHFVAELPATPPEIDSIITELKIQEHTHNLEMDELIESYIEADRQWDRYADIFNFASVAFANIAPNGAIFEINIAGAILLGIKASESKRHRLADRIVPDQQEAYRAFLERLFTQEGPHQIEVGLVATEHHPAAIVLINGNTDENRQEGRLVINEITRERENEQSLRKSNHLLEIAQHAALAGTWEIDLVNNRVHFSAALFRILGLNPDQVSASIETWNNSVHPDDREAARQRLQECIENKTSLYNPYRFRLPSGEVRWMESYGELKSNAAGRVVAVNGVAIDVTERKKVELSLQANMAMLKEAEAIAHVGSWRYIEASRSLVWSDETFRIFGHEAQAFSPSYENFVQQIHPEDRHRIESDFAQSLQQKRPQDSFTFRIVLPSGEVRHVRNHCRNVFAGNGAFIEAKGIVQDISHHDTEGDAEQLRSP